MQQERSIQHYCDFLQFFFWKNGRLKKEQNARAHHCDGQCHAVTGNRLDVKKTLQKRRKKTAGA